MLQLNEVAVVTFSATFRPIGSTYERNAGQNGQKRRRIWLLLFRFKAKHRARRLQRKAETASPYRTQNLAQNSPIITSNIHSYKFAELDTFHRASKSIIYFGQLFGVLPLKNILADNPYEVDFRLESYPMLFTLMFLVFGGLKTLQFTRSTLESGINMKNIVSLVFVYSNLTTCVRLVFLAKNWPRLLQHWTRVELIFLMPPYEPISSWTLRSKLQTLACIFAIIALLEHSLYFASGFYNYRMVSIHCQHNGTVDGSFKSFVVSQFQDLFSHVSYNIFWAGYAFFLNGNFTFIWNYLDVFIMLISLSLAVRFQQLAKRIRSLRGRFVSEDIWYELRQHHIQLCELMANIDANFSGLVLISCIINMYFICNQLLNIFTKLRWPINYVYFWISLSYLIGRTASVFLCAARIHDASLLPLRSLYMIPSSCWTEEVQRFYAQIQAESIALTGKRFFQMTRKSFFGFMATIVTYEFMLLQFDAKNWKKGLPPLCP